MCNNLIETRKQCNSTSEWHYFVVCIYNKKKGRHITDNVFLDNVVMVMKTLKQSPCKWDKTTKNANNKNAQVHQKYKVFIRLPEHIYNAIPWYLLVWILKVWKTADYFNLRMASTLGFCGWVCVILRQSKRHFLTHHYILLTL